MNCRRARHLLFDFFDGASNEALRAEVDRHLGECEDCDRFASEMTHSLALLRRVPMEPLDDNFNWKVRLAIHREKNAALERAASAHAWVRMWNVRYALSTGLALSAALVAGALLLAQNGTVPVPAQFAQTSPQNMQQPNAGPSPVPRSSLQAPVNDDLFRTVSTGHTDEDRNPAPVGAIDEARIDSLINADVMRLPEHERDQYIQRRIDRLRAHQSQPAPPQH
jgi:anti-sigma factor RsiW